MEWESFERQLKIETTSKCFERTKSAAAVAELLNDEDTFKLIYASPAMADLFGVSREELVSGDFLDVFPEYNLRWNDFLRSVEADESCAEYSFTTYLSRNDRVVEVRAFRSGEGCCILLACDITGRVDNDMESTQSVALYRTDKSTDIISFWVDDRLSLRLCGRRGIEMLGTDSNGNTPSEESGLVDFMLPDDIEAVKGAVISAKDGDRLRLKFRLASDEHEVRSVECLIKTDDSRGLTAGGVIRDITEYTKRDDALCRLPYMMGVSSDNLLAVFYFNLTAGTCECRFSKNDCIKGLAEKGSADVFFSRAYNRLDDYKQLVDYQQRFGCRRMCELYEIGNLASSLDHRMMIDNERRWVRTESALFKSDEGDICAWLFMSDTDLDRSIRALGYTLCSEDSALLIDSKSGAVRELPQSTGEQRTYASWVNARLCGKVLDNEKETFEALALDNIRHQLEQADKFEVEIKAGGIIGHQIWSFSRAYDSRDTFVLYRKKAADTENSSEITQRCERLETQLAGAQEVSATQARMSTVLSAHLDNATKSLREANAEIDRLVEYARKSDAEYTAQITEQNRLYDILKGELNDEYRVKAENAVQLTRFTAQIEADGDKISSLEAHIDNLDGELADAHAQIADLTIKLGDLGDENTRNADEAARLAQELGVSRSETAAANENAEQIKLSLTEQLESERDSHRSTALKLNEMTAENDKNVENSARLTDELADARSEVSELEAQLEDERRRIKSLSEDLASEQRENNRNAADAARLAKDLEDTRAEAKRVENDLNEKLAAERRQVKDLTSEVRAERRAKEALSDSAAKLTIDLENAQKKAYQYKQGSQQLENALAEERKQSQQLDSALDDERHEKDKAIDSLNFELEDARERIKRLESDYSEKLAAAQQQTEQLRAELEKQLAIPAQTLARAEYTGDMREKHDASRSRLSEMRQRLSLAAAGEHTAKRTEAAEQTADGDAGDGSGAESRARRRRSHENLEYSSRRSRTADSDAADETAPQTDTANDTDK